MFFSAGWLACFADDCAPVETASAPQKVTSPIIWRNRPNFLLCCTRPKFISSGTLLGWRLVLLDAWNLTTRCSPMRLLCGFPSISRPADGAGSRELRLPNLPNRPIFGYHLLAWPERLNPPQIPAAAPRVTYCSME